MENIISKRPKKLAHWHDNLVVFLTPEAKEMGWPENTIVTVSLVEVDGKKRIVIEKGTSP
jgi:hypothetical protein